MATLLDFEESLRKVSVLSHYENHFQSHLNV